MTHCQQQKENSCGRWQRIKTVVCALKGMILLVPTVLILFAMLGAWTCRFIAPSDFMPIAYLGLGFPLTLIVYIIWVFVLVIFGSKKLLLLLSPTAICLPIMLDTFPVNISPSEDSNIKKYKILTYNVGAFLYEENSASGIAKLIKEGDYDIVCMQEYILHKVEENKDFQNVIKDFPYSTVGEMSNDSYNRVATLSKHKIIKSGLASKGKGHNTAIYSDLIIEDDTIRVVNAHLASNEISFSDKQEIDSIKHGLDVDNVRYKGQMLYKKMTENYIIREQMANDIDSVVAMSKYKMIVGGGGAYNKYIRIYTKFLKLWQTEQKTYSQNRGLLKMQLIY